MYSLGFLPLIIFMRGVAGAALLLDIIQLRFFVLQAVLPSEMAIILKIIGFGVIGCRAFYVEFFVIVECCHTS
ncbi:hypothetical protein J2Y86_001702 [Pseudomonas migulae]|uniref:hypothetical protein n=1 Tax=Pseudomonas migulae TaxID=78543 RepID=UPI0020A0B090|nr:hypothetical protein [Pseudomonas migulae]MCP1496995.1 hypothetical protein [Pseudomonas migulae]